MATENLSLDFRLKKAKKHKKVFRVLNYFEYFLVFVSVFSVCVSISAFASLVGVTVDIASSGVE